MLLMRMHVAAFFNFQSTRALLDMHEPTHPPRAPSPARPPTTRPRIMDGQKYVTPGYSKARCPPTVRVLSPSRVLGSGPVPGGVA